MLLYSATAVEQQNERKPPNFVHVDGHIIMNLLSCLLNEMYS